jgi:hypothetical protein
MAGFPGMNAARKGLRLLDDGSALVEASKGYWFRIDRADLEAVWQRGWCATENRSAYGCKVYITARSPRGGRIGLHRWLLKAPPGLQVDHANGDTLDNRRSNIRVCTRAQNTMNQRVRPSGRRGIWWDRRCRTWRIVITVRGRTVRLGSTPHQRIAQRIYNNAARQHFGEFARTA